MRLVLLLVQGAAAALLAASGAAANLQPEEKEQLGALVLRSLISALANGQNVDLDLLGADLPAARSRVTRAVPATNQYQQAAPISSLFGALAGTRKPRSGTAALEWRSCGSKKDPMRLQKLEIHPNPVKVPGMLRAEMALLVKEPINPPIKIAVQVEKEVPLPLGLGSTWIELPCPGDSCSVADVCSPEVLPRDGSICPAPSTDGLPANYNSTASWRECACPIPKGLYAMPPLEFNLTSPAALVPDYLLNGGFYIKMKLSRHKRRLACIETQLDLDL